jgi:hypothetical protein
MLGMKARLKTQLIVLAVTVGAVAFVWWAGPTRLWANPLNWTDEANLSNTSNTTDAHPDIEVHGQTVYVVWTEQITPTSSGYDPFYAQSTDGGANWSSPTNISDSMDTRSDNVSVAIDEEGKPHFVWAEREGEYDIYYSDLTSTVKITQTGGRSLQPDTAVANDKVHVVWGEFFSGILYASKWVTETWPNDPSVENISTGLANAYRVPDMAVGGDGVIHAVWTEYYTADGDQWVYYNRRLPTGWQTPINILSPTYTSGLFDYPAIAVSGTYSVYVIYSRNDSDPGKYDEQYAGFVKSTDGGQTWSVPKTITGPLAVNTAAPSSIVADIAVDDQGLRAVWSGVPTEASHGNEIIFYGHSTDEGATWIIEQVTTDSTRNRTTPAMAVAQGTVHLVWARGLPTLRDAYYSSGGQQGNGGDGGVYLPLILKNY